MRSYILFFLELIDEANETYKQLNTAVWHLSINLLTQSGQNIDQDNIMKIRNTFPHNETYWKYMEYMFHHLLSTLKVDYNEMQIFSYWKSEQVKALQKAWHEVEKAAGMDTRSLRALNKSGGIIAQRINELKLNVKKEENV